MFIYVTYRMDIGISNLVPEKTHEGNKRSLSSVRDQRKRQGSGRERERQPDIGRPSAGGTVVHCASEPRSDHAGRQREIRVHCLQDQRHTMISTLAGRTSILRALPLEELANPYEIELQQAQQLQSVFPEESSCVNVRWTYGSGECGTQCFLGLRSEESENN